MALAAYGGLEAMNSAEIKPKELRLGKPCAGKPLARFDEGEGRVCGLPLRCALYSTTPGQVLRQFQWVILTETGKTN